MSEQWPNPFLGGGRFVANPHLYDYVHTLVFDPAGTIEMVDGAGQVLNTLVKGRFTVEERGPAAFLVSFADLVEIDPYYRLKRFRDLDRDAFSKAVRENVPYEEGDVRSRPDPYSVNITREEGQFLLRRHIVWKITDEQEWPYLLYRVRYRFAFDPLATHESNRQRNLYYQSEAPEPDTRVYYRAEDAQALTARELAQAGIAREDKLQTMQEEHVEYYKNGNVKGKGLVVDGKMEGYWEWFRKDGTKMRSGHFKASEQVGEWITYDQQGQVYKVTNMDKKSKRPA